MTGLTLRIRTAGSRSATTPDGAINLRREEPGEVLAARRIHHHHVLVTDIEVLVRHAQLRVD
jgi:hypothetical protein